MAHRFEQKRRKTGWAHLASLLLCVITSPCTLSAPNSIPPPEGSISSTGQESSWGGGSVVGGGGGQSSSSSSSSMYTMLSDGETQMDVEKHNKSAIFLLGNKGSGQEALAQTIIANYQMESSAEQESSAYVPHYMVNHENSMAFYNFPGFEATKSAESDTASAYFMEKVTKHVSQVKFLFTVTHSSVQQTSGGSSGGTSNGEFDLMVTNAAKLLTPSETGKFSSSIGLVITNVQGQGMTDQVILSGTESFLVSYKQQLNGQLNGQGLGEEARILVQRKVTFVEALLRRAVSGGSSLNSVWFLRGNGGTTGSPGGNQGTPTTPSGSTSSITTYTTPGSSGGSEGTTPDSTEGTQGTTPNSTGGSQGTTPNSTGGNQGTTPNSTGGNQGTTPNSTGGNQGTTPNSTGGSQGTTSGSSEGTPTTPSSTGGSTGNPDHSDSPDLPESELHSRRNITDLYMNRLQFSSVTHSDFTISLASQTLATIQSTFMPQISIIMKDKTSSVVQNVASSYYSNFFESAFIKQNSSLSTALASLNLDYNNILQSGLVSISDDLTSIFTHPLESSSQVFHLDVITKLSQFLRISFPVSYLSSMGAMTNWVSFFLEVTHTSQTGPSITETAVLSVFNQIHAFRDKVSREICNTNCGSHDGGGGSGGLPFHLR